MSIADRIARLDPRQQRLLNGALLALGVLLVLLLPVSLSAIAHARRSDNQALRDASDSIADNLEAIQRAKLERTVTLERYARPAPPLAPFLSGLAAEAGVEIPESQDRQGIPHGKRYTERTTKFSLHKVGMLKLSKFMERIEQSGNPVTISSLNIRKRADPPDQYDVEMVVSAFDRSAAPDKPKNEAAASPDRAQQP